MNLFDIWVRKELIKKSCFKKEVQVGRSEWTQQRNKNHFLKLHSRLVITPKRSLNPPKPQIWKPSYSSFELGASLNWNNQMPAIWAMHSQEEAA